MTFVFRVHDIDLKQIAYMEANQPFYKPIRGEVIEVADLAKQEDFHCKFRVDEVKITYKRERDKSLIQFMDVTGKIIANI